MSDELCDDCPDHEACMTGAPCAAVKRWANFCHGSLALTHQRCDVQESHLPHWLVCETCLQRRDLDLAKPGIVASGGWMAPKGSTFDLTDSNGCHPFNPGPRPKLVLGLNPKKWARRRRAWVQEMAEWREDLAMEGRTVHAYPAPLSDSLLKISAKRGGVKFTDFRID